MQKAENTVECLAGNLLVDRMVEDMAGEHYKEVHYRRVAFVAVHMVAEVPADIHSVGHKAHLQVVRIVDSWAQSMGETRFRKEDSK